MKQFFLGVLVLVLCWDWGNAQSSFEIIGSGDSLQVVETLTSNTGGQVVNTSAVMDSTEVQGYLLGQAVQAYRTVSRYKVAIEDQSRNANRLRLLNNQFDVNYFDLTYESFGQRFFGDYELRSSANNGSTYFSFSSSQANDRIRARGFTVEFEREVINASAYAYDTTAFQSAAQELLQLGYEQRSDDRFVKRTAVKTNTDQSGTVVVYSDRSFLVRNYFSEDVEFNQVEANVYLGFGSDGTRYLVRRVRF